MATMTVLPASHTEGAAKGRNHRSVTAQLSSQSGLPSAVWHVVTRAVQGAQRVSNPSDFPRCRVQERVFHRQSIALSVDLFTSGMF